LLLRGRLNLETTAGRDAHAHLKAGDLEGLSIGFRVPQGGERANSDGTQTLTEIDLKEVSVVSIAANQRARVTAIKSPLQLRSQSDLERVLRDAGLARGAAMKIAAGGFPALFDEEPEPDNQPQLDRFLARLKAATADLKKG
jgi:hypothetical protein